jgi:glycosyltransferase involved in cell wall biosynthesis
VGIVGRIDPNKGVDLFLEAAARVTMGLPQCRFLVVGGALLGTEGDLADRLVAYAGHLGLAGRVVFTGHLDDPVPAIDALDIAVQASAHEAFGLSTVEAMALGVPVVATRTDGSRDVVEHAVSGLLVDRDASALAEAVAMLVREPALRQRLATGAAVRAQTFSEERMGVEFRRLLDRVAHAEDSTPNGRPD